MKTQTIYKGGTEMNKIAFSEMENAIKEKGFNSDSWFNLMADEKEFVYISNGFVRGLQDENTESEWHHYFTKDTDGTFTANKMRFS